MNFSQAEEKFRGLKARFAAGDLTETDFKAQLEELMVEDEAGGWWMIGYETERWYHHDGTNWVQQDPPGRSAPEPSPAPAAEPAPAPTPAVEAAPAETPAPKKMESGKAAAGPVAPKASVPARRRLTGLFIGLGLLGLVACAGVGFFIFNSMSAAPTATQAPVAAEVPTEAVSASIAVEPATSTPEPTALPTEAPTAAPTPIPTMIVVPQQWDGTYSYPSTGDKQRISLLIEKVNGRTFTGKMIWYSSSRFRQAILKMNGEFVTDFGGAGEQGKWDQLSDYQDGIKTGTYLKWTETEIVQGRNYTVNGWYYAHMREDGTMVAVYFFSKDAVTADAGAFIFQRAP